MAVKPDVSMAHAPAMAAAQLTSRNRHSVALPDSLRAPSGSFLYAPDASPRQSQALWRPAEAAFRPCSLNSPDWSDLEDFAGKAANATAAAPAAAAHQQAPGSWQPQLPLPNPGAALVDASNERAPERPTWPPPGRKSTSSARPQGGPPFAVPCLQAPRLAAQLPAGRAAGAAPLASASSGAALGMQRPATGQPGTMLFNAPGQELRRNVVVPDSFSLLPEYQRTWTAALTEEASLRWALSLTEKHSDSNELPLLQLRSNGACMQSRRWHVTCSQRY